MCVVAEKSRETKKICESSQVPFSAELRRFFTLSRTYQTQFSYTEKYHRSRKFQFHEKNLINEFITYTMFFKCNGGTSVPNMDDEGRVVKNITERMIEESKKYNCEVHFNVIWVHYFTYRDKEINSLPVFKIHKDRSNDAVYLDAFSKVYQTWDCYIDGSGLEESLLCVPRNGEYCFDGGELNLEYVLTKSDLSEFSSTSSSWIKHVAPLPQYLQNWVRQLRSWLLDHPKINSIVEKFQKFVKENHEEVFRIAKAIVLAYLQPELKTSSELARWCFEAIKIICMYINVREYFEALNSFLTLIENTIAKNWEHYPEAKEILLLLNQPSKDWIKIFDSLSCLIKKIRSLD